MVRSPTRKVRRRRWLLLLVSGLTPIALAEIALRLFDDVRVQERDDLTAAKPHNAEVLAHVFRYDADERVRYTLRPSVEIADKGATYRINSLGLRGPEMPTHKPAGQRRILMLGDSYAFGLGVDQDGIVTAALERDLDDRPGPIRALDMGVPGYHTGQELALLERQGFDLEPDLVVLFYCSNDESEEGFQYDPVIGVLYGDVLPVPYSWKYYLRRSAIYGFLADRVARAKLESGELKAMEPHQWPPTRDRLLRLFASCREHGVPLILLNLPTLLNTVHLVDTTWKYHANYDRIGELADQEGVPWVDLRARLRQELETIQAIELLYVSKKPLDPHLNARGYEIVAAALVAKIDELGLLR